MAELSLSAYQGKLIALLADDRHDEVIAHARHILKSHPKNLRAYQLLGEALVARSRWEEAAEVLRRSLGAEARDFNTHALLARVYHELEQLERAIWHAERAFDLRSNNQEIISLIRGLYREKDGVEIERMQMTATALAEQHIRNNLLDDALNVLNQALERNPGRIDMQLLRARTLWLAGRRTDAAEAADEILEQLPWSITANRIMSEMWLSEERPSDAQQYLRRIEDLDPYLAHQMATGTTPPDTLVMLEELDYASIPQMEQAIVNPAWLDNLSEGDDVEAGSGGLEALLRIDDDQAAQRPPTATADLDDLLSDQEIDDLFYELISGEEVAAETDEADEAEAVIAAMDEQGLFSDSGGDESADADEDGGIPLVNAQTASAQSGDESESPALDDELAGLLAQLDEEEDDNSWLMEIQQSSLNLLDEESLDYLEDFEQDWLMEPEAKDDEAGAPWLSAAMREMTDESNDELDIFGDDEQLQKLLNTASDTEPIHLDDIEAWLKVDDIVLDEVSDEVSDDMVAADDSLLDERSWLDDASEDDQAELPLFSAPAIDEEQNRRNADLVDSWQQELGDDDDEDPYIDWLSEGSAGDIDDDLAIITASDSKEETDAPAAELDPASSLGDNSAETARAWGLQDEAQLADFVEGEVGLGDAEAAPSWLNAMVPGLDRQGDAEPERELEFAVPTAGPGKEFGWVSEIVEEETGEMKAVTPPSAAEETLYFSFSNPPLWLALLRGSQAPQSGGEAAPVEAVTALAVSENLDELDLDDLTFDDYFNFDTPTDKMDAIHLDDDGSGINFAELDWDDYFDFDSPTEKTIAITLDEDPADINFEELGVEDEDFDYDTPTEKMPAITLEAEPDPLEFEDIGLDDDAGLISGTETNDADGVDFLDYDDTSGDDAVADEEDNNRGSTPL